jgi:hypothetical protein
MILLKNQAISWKCAVFLMFLGGDFGCYPKSYPITMVRQYTAR